MNREKLVEVGWKPIFDRYFFELSQQHPNVVVGRVATVVRDRCEVWTGRDEACAAFIPNSLYNCHETDLPVVGDFVALVPNADRMEVASVLPRFSHCARAAAGIETKAQPIVANVDSVWIVTSVGHDFNPARVERYLAAIWAGGSEPLIVVTKTDLDHDREEIDRSLGEFAVPVLFTRADSDDLEQFSGWLESGDTVALVGSSGVGKSTLINKLTGAELRTGGIRESDGRGRHTTTQRHMLRTASGAMIVDTPGMREFGLWDAEAGLDQLYADVLELAAECKFRDCQHLDEPDCAVWDAVELGILDEERIYGYQKLLRENRHLQRRAKSRQRDQAHKAISKAMRQRTKLNRRLGIKDW